MGPPNGHHWVLLPSTVLPETSQPSRSYLPGPSGVVGEPEPRLGHLCRTLRAYLHRNGTQTTTETLRPRLSATQRTTDDVGFYSGRERVSRRVSQTTCFRTSHNHNGTLSTGVGAKPVYRVQLATFRETPGVYRDLVSFSAGPRYTDRGPRLSTCPVSLTSGSPSCET